MRSSVGRCSRRASMYSSTHTGATYCSTIAVATRRLLDGEIVEVVGGRQPENSQQKELHQMAAAHPQRRSLLQQQNRRRISSAMVVRLCARISGSIGRRACVPPAKACR